MKLSDKIEAASAGSRELDAEVFSALGTPLPKRAFGLGVELLPDPNNAHSFVVPIGELQVRYECPHYTTSLDVAMTLGLEEFTPQELYAQFYEAVNRWVASGSIDPFDMPRFISAAALRARGL